MYCSPACTHADLEVNPGTVTEVAVSLDCGIHQNAKMTKLHILQILPFFFEFLFCVVEQFLLALVNDETPKHKLLEGWVCNKGGVPMFDFHA